MQGQSNVDVNFVIKEYQETVADLTNENLLLRAYVKQLEAQVKELQEPTESKEEK